MSEETNKKECPKRRPFRCTHAALAKLLNTSVGALCNESYRGRLDVHDLESVVEYVACYWQVEQWREVRSRSDLGVRAFKNLGRIEQMTLLGSKLARKLSDNIDKSDDQKTLLADKVDEFESDKESNLAKVETLQIGNRS